MFKRFGGDREEYCEGNEWWEQEEQQKQIKSRNLELEETKIKRRNSLQSELMTSRNLFLCNLTLPKLLMRIKTILCHKRNERSWLSSVSWSPGSSKTTEAIKPVLSVLIQHSFYLTRNNTFLALLVKLCVNDKHKIKSNVFTHKVYVNDCNGLGLNIETKLERVRSENK